VPYEFHGVTFGNYGERDGQTAAIKAAKVFVDAPTRDLYLTGGVGAGKSRLAAAIANTLHRKRRTVSFQRVPYLLHQLQPGRDNAQLEERLLTVSVLVLDDLGAERDQATDYTRRTLLMLYEARCDANRRTVFTSNKSLQELAEMQDDDRLSSRIAGRCDVVKVTTPDQRLRRVK
jgi:DNA replication protein DnaC